MRATEFITEVSNRTLANYVKKAIGDKSGRIPYELSRSQNMDKNRRQWMNRDRGIDQALNKLGADKQEQLDELQFLGSECTKDCSGHRAGYDWSKRQGGVDANSPWSPSFNKGAALAKAGK